MKRPIFLLCALFAICSCEQTFDPQTPDSDSGVLFLNMDLKSAPLGIHKISGQLSNPDFAPILFEFDIAENSAYALLENIAEGTWFLQVNAYDSNDNMILTGSQEIEVITNQLVSVTLDLKGTGSVEIIVRWPGTENPGGDEFEENDKMEDAASIYEGNYYAGLTISNEDEDWYRIDVSSSRITVVCNFQGHFDGLQVHLVDQNGSVLARSKNYHDYEIVDYRVSQLGTYYIGVFLPDHDHLEYMIWWQDY